ncbi:MAG: hypothetical protein U9N47_06105 [Thermodesulfobacteriota bacterium]|nr:hypothetical protein [Thermodesulfobacteriota bacterium]
MNILDENIINNQCQLLRSWRIPFRQIGFSIGRQGLQDKGIITLLHTLHRPTFFTRDDDFYDCNLSHAGYCLVYLAVRKDEVAIFMRRLLHYKKFDTEAKRMGSVIRVSHAGLSVWRLHTQQQIRFGWTD